MFGLKTNKTLREELANLAREYEQTRFLLIHRTTTLQQQEERNQSLHQGFDKLLAKATDQDRQIKELARVIIQASRNQGMDEFCTTADSLCETFPDLAPKPQDNDTKEDALLS